MAEKEKSAQDEDEKCVHPLLCADEWKDPEGAEVVAEYHKDEGGLSEEEGIERDLDAFEKYWLKKESINLLGEYHKAGAPYMEAPSGWEGHRPRSSAQSAEAAIAIGAAIPPQSTEQPAGETGSAQIVAEPSTMQPPSETRPTLTPVRPSELPKGTETKPLKISEVVDINSLEVMSYWIFRLAFGKELHIPIKKEGMADLDVHIHNKDVIVNTNQLYFVFPELVVWHITYTHKGRPIMEIGRGVKKGLKVHRINAFRLLIEVWMGSKRAEKESRLAELKGPSTLEPEKEIRDKDVREMNEKGDIT
jgi:hypothetical protein